MVREGVACFANCPNPKHFLIEGLIIDGNSDKIFIVAPEHLRSILYGQYANNA
ncbi:MAG: hypothetical protein CFH10_00525 [Alphaproteobacteria bacterium MarineAlpha4_Bin2]|nr:MAG: hypothetical protein CFH10_00525 [Alphaproteobacteria bacterium MarineAlpha4_Bin2]